MIRSLSAPLRAIAGLCLLAACLPAIAEPLSIDKTAVKDAAVAGDDAVLYRLGEQKFAWQGVRSVTWHPDGKHVIVPDPEQGAMSVDLETGEMETFVANAGAVKIMMAWLPPAEDRIILAGASGRMPMALVHDGAGKLVYGQSLDNGGETIAFGTKRMYQIGRGGFGIIPYDGWGDAEAPDGTLALDATPMALAANPDDSALAIWTEDLTITVVNPLTLATTAQAKVRAWTRDEAGEMGRRLTDFGVEKQSNSRAIAWSPDGSQIVVTSTFGLVFLDAKTLEETSRVPRHLVQAMNVHWHRDGKRLTILAATEGASLVMQQYDRDSGAWRDALAVPAGRWCGISPDESKVLLYMNSLALVDLDKWQVTIGGDSLGADPDLTWMPESQHLVVRTESQTLLYDKDGKQVAANIPSARPIPGRDMLVIGDRTELGYHALPGDGEAAWTLALKGTHYSVNQFEPEGSGVLLRGMTMHGAQFSQGWIAFGETEPQAVPGLQENDEFAAFLPGAGHFLLRRKAEDKTETLWIYDGKAHQTLAVPEGFEIGAGNRAIYTYPGPAWALRPTGYSRDFAVYTDATQPAIVVQDLSLIALSPDGAYAVAMDRWDMHLLDLAAGKEIAKLYDERFRTSDPGVAFNHDSTRLWTSHNGVVTCWDLARLKAAATAE